MKRRLFKILLILLLLGTLLIGLITLWAVRSDGGRDFLMARIAAQLPEGSSLRWANFKAPCGTAW